VDATGWAGAAGLTTAALGGIAAIIAAIARRRSDRETVEEAAARAVREERATLVAEYRGLLDEMRLAAADQDRRWDQRLAGIERELAAARADHDECEAGRAADKLERDALASRLHLAEARIAELGG
jgi:hypothetical protein